MTRNEMIECLADYFNLDYPEKDEDGNYNIHRDYDWTSGCSFGEIGTPWLTLENVVNAVADHLEDEEEEY